MENRTNQATRLRDWLNIDSAQLLNHDLSSKANTKSGNSPSQNRLGERKKVPNEELVKHMSNLPSYLEKGDNPREKVLSFGVLDWRRLEKWQHSNKQTFSPSSSNDSSYFSTDISSTRSSQGQSSSPGEIAVKSNKLAKREVILNSKYHSRSKLQEISPKECKREDIAIQITRKSKIRNDKSIRQVDVEYSDFGAKHNYHEKGKDKAQSDDFESNHRGIRQASLHVKLSSESFESSACSSNFRNSPSRGENRIGIPKKITDQSEPKQGMGKNHKLRNTSPDRFLSSSLDRLGRRSNSLDLCPEANLSKTEKKKDVDCSEIRRLRNSSPTRRFNIGLNRFGRRSSSLDFSNVPHASSEHDPSISQSKNVVGFHTENASNDKSGVGRKSQTSPLRRLLEPLLKPKSVNCNHSSDTSEKGLGKLSMPIKHKSSTIQALVQMSIKNGLPLFTFADDKNSGVLAATMKKLTTSKIGSHSWLYTFFNVDEVKKKKGWINKGCKGETYGYNPSVIAQMRVSDIKQNPLDKFSTREFVSFSVDVSENDQTSTFYPKDELAAILVKFPKDAPSYSGKLESSYNNGNDASLSIMAILPGGSHGHPSKGKPSPLIERWKSGGECDCGGWDMGCRLKVLTSLAKFGRRSNFSDNCQAADTIELFSQEEDTGNKPTFILSPFKDHIYSVEFDSSHSFLQAFSICISILNCRKPNDLSELSKLFEEKTDDTSKAGYVIKAPNPPLSPVGRV